MADVHAQASSVQAAVLSMYGLTPGPPEAQQEAIRWLLGFEGSAAALAVQPLLLSSSVQQVRFYAANGLYTQVRSNWHLVGPEQCVQVTDNMWSALATGPTDMDAKRRLCLALAAAAVQSPGGVPALVARAAQLYSAALSAADDFVSVRLYLVCELLRCVAEMNDELQLPGRVREALTHDTRQALPQVLTLLQMITAVSTSPVSVDAVVCALSAGASPAQAGCPALATGLSAATSWLGVACSALDSGVHTGWPGLLQAALVGIGTHDDAVCTACSEYVSALFDKHSNDVDLSARAAVMVGIGSHLALAGPNIIASARGARRYASAAAVAKVLSTLFEDGWAFTSGASLAPPPGVALASFPFLCAALDAPQPHTGPAVGGEPAGLGLLLGDLLLQAACIPDASVQDATCDSFLAISYVSPGDRHAYFRRRAIFQQILVHACMAIGEGGAWASRDGAGDEQRLELRQKAFTECIGDAVAVCETSVVHALLPLLHGGANPSPILVHLLPALPPAVTSSSFHARLEAVLYALTSCCAPGRNFVELLVDGDDEERAGTGGSDPATHEVIVALLVEVLRQEPAALPPDLACTTCQLLKGLKGWLASLPEGGVVRRSRLPPFEVGPIAGCPNEATAFATMPVAELLSMAVLFLCKALQCTRAVIPGLRLLPPASADVCAAYVEGKSVTDGGLAPTEDEAEDDEGGCSVSLQDGVLCIAAASTLASLQCEPAFLRLQGGAVLRGVVSAIEAGTQAGLPLPARATLLERLLFATRVMMPPGEGWDAFAKLLLGPVLARVVACGSRIVSTPPGQALAAEDVRVCIEDVTVLGKVMAMTPSDAVVGSAPPGDGEDGQWLGSGGAHSARAGPSGPHILQFVCDAVWGGLDGVVARLHDSPPAVSVLLYFYRQCVRLFPGPASARLPSIISASVQLYSAHLYASATSTVEYALVNLLKGVAGAPPPSTVSAVAGLVAEMTRSTAEAVARGGRTVLDAPDVLEHFFALLSAVVHTCPTALTALPEGALTATMRLSRAAFGTNSRLAAKRATEFLKQLFALGGYAVDVPAGVRAAATRAAVEAAGELGAALIEALTIETTNEVTSTAIEALTVLARAPGGVGQHVRDGALAAVAAVFARRAQEALLTAPAGSEHRARLEGRLATSQPMEPAGYLCLTLDEHVHLLAAAFQVAGDTRGVPLGGAAASSPVQGPARATGAPQRLRLLLTEYANLCQRKIGRDALIVFGLKA